jgi:hypothetical protein
MSSKPPTVLLSQLLPLNSGTGAGADKICCSRPFSEQVSFTGNQFIAGAIDFNGIAPNI